MALSTGARKRTGALAAAAVTVGFGALLLANYGPGAAPKPLLLATPLAGLPDLGDYAWNLAARSQPVALALWLLVAEAFGWLAWPLVARVCDRLPDRGLSSAKTVGLLIVAWLVWVAASLRLAPFTVWTILAAAVVLALASALAAWGRVAALRQFLRAQWRLVVGWEVLFLLAFAALLGLRLLDPDLWNAIHGGEKPMDFGFLNAVLRSAWMPPPDPFFAGGYINYYYYGQFLVACPLKLIGAPPSVGYNLALPHLYALLVVGTAGVVYNAVAGARGRAAAFRWGLAAAALVAVAGNLHGGLQLWSIWAPDSYRGALTLFHDWGLTAPSMSQPFSQFEYWPPSRIIPRTINEFPYWIFLAGDLHAHLIALPVQVAALALALDTVLRAWASRGAPFWGAGLADGALRVATLAIVFGALAVINTWDFLTYALLLAGGVALAAARGAAARRVVAALKAAVAVAVVLMLAILLYAPFFLSFQAFYTQLKPLIDGVDGMRRTRLAEWLVIWGLFAFLAGACSLLALRPLLRRSVVARTAAERRPLITLALGLLVVVACALAGQWTLAALALLLGVAGAALAVAATPASAFGAALIVVGLLAAAGVELFYVADFLQDTEWYRMNTVFKFYMQAWALLGCGVTASLALLAPRAGRAGPRAGRALWLAALVVLLGAAGSFVVGGTQSRLQERFPVRPPGPTLDGMAFLDDNTFSWGPEPSPAQVNFADDHAAYNWLLAHAHGFPIIATAPTAPDPEGMFVATYTGLPIVVGSMHQEEQRYPDQVAARRADMTELYRTPDAARAGALLRKYDVRYVYLGPYERVLAAGAPAGLAKFAVMAPTLQVAFQHGDVTIYQTAGGP